MVSPLPPDIEWTCDAPLVTNPVVVRQLVWTFLLSGLIVTALLAIAFWGSGSLDSLPMVAGIIFTTCGALLLTGFIASLLIYGNRMTMRFRLTSKAVEATVTDKTARRVARAVVVLGALTGKPGAAGTGLLALSNSNTSSSWKGLHGARFNPANRSIELHNSWRTVLVLFCTSDNYESVSAFVNAHIAAPATAGFSTSPLWRGLMWTVAVIVASLPSFAMPWPFEAELLPAMIMVCFAVASVWFLPPLAWALLAAISWVAITIVATALETTTSIFKDKPPFPAYEIASGDDWAFLTIEVVALAFLSWFAWRCIRGHFIPVLLDDMGEMEKE